MTTKVKEYTRYIGIQTMINRECRKSDFLIIRKPANEFLVLGQTYKLISQTILSRRYSNQTVFFTIIFLHRLLLNSLNWISCIKTYTFIWGQELRRLKRGKTNNLYISLICLYWIDSMNISEISYYLFFK